MLPDQLPFDRHASGPRAEIEESFCAGQRCSSLNRTENHHGHGRLPLPFAMFFAAMAQDLGRESFQGGHERAAVGIVDE